MCRVIEVASHATLLLSMTALQQQQQQPTSLSLPLSLPASDCPHLVTIKHSSANADLRLHALVIEGQGAGLWVGDVQQQPVRVRICRGCWRRHFFGARSAFTDALFCSAAGC